MAPVGEWVADGFPRRRPHLLPNQHLNNQEAGTQVYSTRLPQLRKVNKGKAGELLQNVKPGKNAGTLVTSFGQYGPSSRGGSGPPGAPENC